MDRVCLSASRYNKTFLCMTNNQFWEIVDRIPDLASKRNLQILLMGNFGLQYGAPWLRKSGSSSCLLCLLCKDSNMEDISHFLFACPKLDNEWATFWYSFNLMAQFVQSSTRFFATATFLVLELEEKPRRRVKNTLTPFQAL